MHRLKIQQVFDNAWKGYAASFSPSPVQRKAASSIMACKSGKLGCNVSVCTDCGHLEFHNNSCRCRSCPNCQALLYSLLHKCSAQTLLELSADR